MNDVVYPGPSYNAKVSGTVTLSGIITSGGDVQQIRVEESKLTPTSLGEPLVREALDNLKTWRLQAAARQDAVLITYEYRIDPSLEYGRSSVEFALPGRVTIRSHLPE